MALAPHEDILGRDLAHEKHATVRGHPVGLDGHGDHGEFVGEDVDGEGQEEREDDEGALRGGA